MKKQKAFTLAEVLTTLMVIGVVAALTIPSMMNSYKKHTYAVAFKKAYSEFSRAMRMIPITEGCDGLDYECSGYFKKTIKEKVEMLSKQYKIESFKLDGHCTSGASLIFNAGACFVTQDGMAIQALSIDGDLFVIDINGPKGPNEPGRDQFGIEVATENKNGVAIGTVMPRGSYLVNQYRGVFNGTQADRYYWKTTTVETYQCTTENPTFACSARILDEGKMNY